MGGGEYVLLGLLCGTKSLVEMLLNQNVLMKIEKNSLSVRGVIKIGILLQLSLIRKLFIIIETDEHLYGF